MMTEQEIKERLLDVENAIASQRLEGVEVDRQTIADLRSAALGEIDTQEVITRFYKRIESGEI